MFLIFKRLVVWLLETLVETSLLGVLFGALLGVLSLSNFTTLLPLVSAGVAVGVVLCLHGYYLTKLLFGVVWRSQRRWTYPAIAATLFVIHMGIAFVRLKPDISPVARASELPFLTGGACIVFACAFVGGWFLQGWVRKN